METITWLYSHPEKSELVVLSRTELPGTPIFKIPYDLFNNAEKENRWVAVGEGDLICRMKKAQEECDEIKGILEKAIKDCSPYSI